MRASRTVLVAALVLVLAAAGGWYWGRRPPEPRDQPAVKDRPEARPTPVADRNPRPTPGRIAEVRTRPRTGPAGNTLLPTRPATAQPDRKRSAAASRKDLPPLPRSLRGTEVDGDLLLDEARHFLPTPEALQLFDYFLSAQGEETLPVIYDRIAAEIRARLPARAAAEARRLLDDYLGYRLQAAQRLQRGLRSGEPLENALKELRALRRQIFGAEVAERIFAPEEEAERNALDQRGDREDRLASSLQRQAQVFREKASGLPREDVLGLHPQVARSLWTGLDRALEAEQTPEQIQARFGRWLTPDAIERLVALNRERVEWKRRWEEYRLERREIDSLPGLDLHARRQLIEELRWQHFTPEEQARVELLDRVESFSARPTP
jgi:lipase chaperone LimK